MENNGKFRGKAENAKKPLKRPFFPEKAVKNLFSPLQLRKEVEKVNVFAGESRHTIDDKGRVVIPARFRDMLGTQFVVCKDIYNVYGTRRAPGVCVFPTEKFEATAAKVYEMPKLAEESEDVIEEFFASASYSEPDKLGRVNIPSNLREFAELTKDVVVVGQFDHLVIYSAEKWDNRRQGKMEDPYKSEQLAESFGAVKL